MADDLKKIKDLVEIIVKKIRGIETQQGVMAEQVRVITGQQSVMNDKLDNVEGKLGSIEEKLDNHTVALMKIEDTIEGYADMYKVNKEKNEELEERVETVEDKLSIPSKN